MTLNICSSQSGLPMTTDEEMVLFLIILRTLCSPPFVSFWNFKTKTHQLSVCTHVHLISTYSFKISPPLPFPFFIPTIFSMLIPISTQTCAHTRTHTHTHSGPNKILLGLNPLRWSLATLQQAAVLRGQVSPDTGVWEAARGRRNRPSARLVKMASCCQITRRC